MANRIQLRRGTAAEWTAANPVLGDGEPGVEKDTGKVKYGNGVAAWSALPYASAGPQGPAGVADDTSVADLVTTPGTETATALSATILDQVETATAGKLDAAAAATTYATKAEAAGEKANTVIIFGDSLTAQSGTGSETLDPVSAPDAIDGRGYWHWANGFLGRKLKLVRNAGIGGNTSAQMLARLNADVLAHPSGWVFLCAGANDVAQDRTLAAIQADMNAIMDAVIAAGRRVLVMTAPPSSSFNTASRREVLGKMNDWIRDLPLVRPGVVVADTYKAIADPATGYPATGMVTDLVHWSEAGALRVGKAVADAVASQVVNRPNKVISLVDPNNVVGNPHMASGTGWSNIGAGFTTAYSVDTNTFRSKATLTYTAGTGAEDTGIQYVEPIANGRYVAGDIVQASVRLKWNNVVAGTSSTVGFIPFLRVWPRKADSSFGVAALAMQTASGNRVAVAGIPSSGELVAVTHRLTLPANIANLYVAAGWTGIVSGTLEISEFSVWKNA